MRQILVFPADESGSDEDFMVEDDDDSDYGHSKKRGKKVIRRGRPDKKEKKSPKPRLKATGEGSNSNLTPVRCHQNVPVKCFIYTHISQNESVPHLQDVQEISVRSKISSMIEP